MTDLRALLTRAGEALAPFAGISYWADHCSEEDRTLGLRDFMLYLESSAFGSGYKLDADDIRRARALRAEITAALADKACWKHGGAEICATCDCGRGQPAPELPERRCDQCDNCIERSWMFCAWCAWPTCIDGKPPAPDKRKE